MTATPEVLSKPPLSDARIEANRANAQKSTGPTTDEGKQRSRMNALKHGLSGAGVAMPETMRQAVQERTAGWASSFKPLNPWELWLLEITAITTLRLEVCEQSRLMSVVLKAQRADHPEIWEVDRENEVAETLAKFAHDPVQQVAKLRQTMQGVRWLLARWEDLRGAGFARHLGNGDARLGVPDARPADRVLGERSLVVARQGESSRVSRLGRPRDRQTDEIAGTRVGRSKRDRTLERGIGATFDHTKEANQIRRYESQNERLMKWAVSQFKKGRHDFDPSIKPPAPTRPWSSSDDFPDSSPEPIAEVEPIAQVEAVAAPAVETAAKVEMKPEGFLSRAARKVSETTQALSVSMRSAAAPSVVASASASSRDRAAHEQERLRKEARARRKRKRALGTLASA